MKSHYFAGNEKEEEDIFKCGNLVESEYYVLLINNTDFRSTFVGTIVHIKKSYESRLVGQSIEFHKSLDFKLFTGYLTIQNDRYNYK